MQPPRLLCLAALAASAAALSAHPPLGEEEFGNAAVRNNDDWPAGTLAVANDAQRAYRRWINGNEDFCYVGGADDLNEALALFARIEGTEHRVLLLPTPGSTRSFEDIEVAYDWRMNAPSGIFHFMIDRELGGSLVHTQEPVLYVHFDGDGAAPGDLVLPPSLRLLGPDEQTAFAREALADDREQVRAEGARWLGRWAHDAGVREALVALLEDEERTVRVAAAAALAEYPEYVEDLAGILNGMLERSADDWERGRLGTMLEELADHEARAANVLVALQQRDAALRELLRRRDGDE